MAQLRGIIIDDNKARRESILAVLPDYIDSVGVGAGEGALDYLKRDGEGNIPDFVIVNGDDPKNFGLYVFDWMINKSRDEDIAAIPVIVLTEDEFSDRCLEFLEIGDVIFYEGEIDESDLFAAINDAIEEAEFMAPPIEPVYEETKNIDRLMGHSVKAPESDGRQRVLVLDMDSRVKNLEAALERGRRRVADIRTLIDAAQRAKEGEDFNLRSRKKVPKSEADLNRMSTFLQKARKKANVEEEMLEALKKQQAKAAAAGAKPASSGQVIKSAGAVEGAEKIIRQPSNPAAEVPEAVERLREKAISNPGGAFNAQGMIRMEERPKSVPRPANANGKKTVVIVDEDVKTRKLCSLFLTQKYNVVACESAMKMIDHFVKSSADLLMINPALGGMGASAAITSMRMQQGGRNVPVMFLVGEDYMQSRAALLGPGVVGILNKPIKQSTIAQSVDGYFDNRGMQIH